jgi:hypothetical protein
MAESTMLEWFRFRFSKRRTPATMNRIAAGAGLDVVHEKNDSFRQELHDDQKSENSS